jgi:hypothetical protein
MKSTVGSDSGSSPTGVVDVKVPKQYMIGRGVGKGHRNKGKNLVGVE